MKKNLLKFLTLALLAVPATAQAADSNTVVVTYDGASATVDVASNLSSYVTYTTNGAHVSIVQSANVSATTVGEITYILSGKSTDGEFYMEGNYKATISLQGLTLTNPTGAAINIQNGKRIDVSVKSGTTNTLTDGAGGDQKGCLACKGHLEFKGKGTLNVAGYSAHAIWAKEYVEVKNCTIKVTAAVKDGINCNQYFLMTSGTINISGVYDDGIQVSLKDEDTSVENTGNFTQEDGTLTISLKTAEGKHVKAAGTVSYNGGTHNFSTDTGISSVELDNPSLSNADAIYDLNGRRVQGNEVRSQGIYVVKKGKNTRKVTVQ